MNAILKNKLLQMGFIIISFSLLTACNTVKGTVTGAGEDIQAVGNTINPPTHHYHHYHHYHYKHTQTMTNKSMSRQNTQSQSTMGGQSMQQKPQTTNQTNTSY